MSNTQEGKSRSKRATARACKAAPVPMPPPSEAEIRTDRELGRLLRQVSAELQQRNLDNALLLARQAARGEGDLVDHFAELGRRFGYMLKQKPKTSKFRVIEGGAA